MRVQCTCIACASAGGGAGASTALAVVWSVVALHLVWAALTLSALVATSESNKALAWGRCSLSPRRSQVSSSLDKADHSAALTPATAASIATATGRVHGGSCRQEKRTSRMNAPSSSAENVLTRSAGASASGQNGNVGRGGGIRETRPGAFARGARTRPARAVVDHREGAGRHEADSGCNRTGVCGGPVPRVVAGGLCFDATPIQMPAVRCHKRREEFAETCHPPCVSPRARDRPVNASFLPRQRR